MTEKCCDYGNEGSTVTPNEICSAVLSPKFQRVRSYLGLSMPGLGARVGVTISRSAGRAGSLREDPLPRHIGTSGPLVGLKSARSSPRKPKGGGGFRYAKVIKSMSYKTRFFCVLFLGKLEFRFVQ